MLEHGQTKTLSGNPILGWNDDNVKLKFGKITHKYLETSNVDVGVSTTP